MALNSTTLLQIKLAGFSIAEIAKYVSTGEHILAKLEMDQIPPQDLMFQHLYECFKECGTCQYESRKMRD
eukprot:6931117-Karenia_brevis.AAC.1